MKIFKQLKNLIKAIARGIMKVIRWINRVFESAILWILMLIVLNLWLIFQLEIANTKCNQAYEKVQEIKHEQEVMMMVQKMKAEKSKPSQDMMMRMKKLYCDQYKSIGWEYYDCEKHIKKILK